MTNRNKSSESYIVRECCVSLYDNLASDMETKNTVRELQRKHFTYLQIHLNKQATNGRLFQIEILKRNGIRGSWC